MKPRAIYIQGCARSGNTLVRELCVAAFADTELFKLTQRSAECFLERLIEDLQSRSDTENTVVASRHRSVSVYMDPALLHAHPEITVIWMLRNPVDVLTSKHKKRAGYYVDPYRLVASLNLYNQFRNDPQVITVRYEDLVSNPERVQAMLQERLELDLIRPFRECHGHFPRFKQNLEALHSVRPIDTDSLDKWKTNPELSRYLGEVLRWHPEIVPLAKICGGYEIDRVAFLKLREKPHQARWLMSLFSGRRQRNAE